MHTILSALLALGVAGAFPVIDPDFDDPGPSLTLPDGPAIPFPPGSRLFGPRDLSGDGARQSQAQPPGQSPASPEASSPDQRRRDKVDDLFKRLAGAESEAEANAIMAALDRLWLQSGSDTADLLMTHALACIQAQDYKCAGDLLDKIVVLRPDWAEGWNQRATLRYLNNDDVDSMADISRVLALEPRHFGALSGMGYILHRNGNDKAALTVFRKAAAINPQNKGIKALIDELTPDVEGHDL